MRPLVLSIRSSVRPVRSSVRIHHHVPAAINFVAILAQTATVALECLPLPLALEAFHAGIILIFVAVVCFQRWIAIF